MKILVHEEWLNEDDIVIPKSVVEWRIKYIEYVAAKYPDVDIVVRRYLDKTSSDCDVK